MGCLISKQSNSRYPDPHHIATEINNEKVNLELIAKKNKRLPDLIKDYFDNSLVNIDFCKAFQSLLVLAIQRLNTDEEVVKVNGSSDDDGSDRFAHELTRFRASGDLFGDEWFIFVQSLYRNQKMMIEKLDSELVAVRSLMPKVKLAKHKHIWMRVENELRGQMQIVNLMSNATCSVIKNLDHIQVLVLKFKNAIETFWQSLESADSQEDAVGEMKNRTSECMQVIEDLSDCTRRFSRDITSAGNMILGKIIEHPQRKYSRLQAGPAYL